MSEPLEERLSKLTPAGTGLDRDALLFEAGRASARPGRRWPALASLLALSQAVTLTLLLWPRTPPPAPAPGAVPGPAVADMAPPPPAAHDPSEAGSLRARLLSGGGDLPAPVPVEDLAPDAPPLRASAAVLANLPSE
jgi:hypothetical protein